MPHDTPTFGQREQGWEYTDRPGAYALIVRDGALLIVDENSGWFLPGGGLEDGESPVDALHREMLEETGFQIRAPEAITRVCQYMISQSEHTAYAKDCHIFSAHITAQPEAGHCELRWVTPAEAVDKLAHECFRWVVEEFLLGSKGA
jgi:8-oxo-dGTP diphosphatase